MPPLIYYHFKRYETILDVEGGGTLPISRRERPQLLRDAKTGAPRILYNAATPLGPGAIPFTFAQLLGGEEETTKTS